MSFAKLIGPTPAVTPPGALNSAARREIPDDLLREASLRLGILALLFATLWVIGTVTGHVAGALSAARVPWNTFDATDVIATVMVTLSLGLFAYTRRTR